MTRHAAGLAARRAVKLIGHRGAAHLGGNFI
jgi:hypothetical protein